MFLDLKRSYDSLSDKSGIDVSAIEFEGFDGNNESEYLHIADYIVNRKYKGQYSGISVFNSHYPTLENYRVMLSEYRQVKNNLSITKEEILKIIDAVRNRN